MNSCGRTVLVLCACWGASADAAPLVVNIVGRDAIRIGSDPDPVVQADLALRPFAAFGGLPELGADGIAGIDFRDNPGGLGALTALGSNSPPVPLSAFTTLVVQEFHFAGPDDLAAAQAYVAAAGTTRFTQRFENIDTVAPQFPSLIAIGFPPATVVTGNNTLSGEFTPASLTAAGGWLAEPTIPPFITLYTITEFYLDPTPFILDGQIASASEFTPFGLRLELIPLFFLPPGGPEIVRFVPGEVIGGETVRFNQRLTFTAVPAPATLALFGLGFAALGVARRRR
jgi:hypothetical protein